MNITSALSNIVAGEALSQAEAKEVFDVIMGGDATPSQIGGILTALKTKGETADEIAGAAMAMREASLKVDVDVPNLVDTCGTGGSGPNKLFNISTASAFVAAGAGAHVAKHGNRGASSKSGSADVLELAGVDITLGPEEIARCIREVGVGFLFAQTHHSAMRFAGPVRKELGIGTVFNLLGPLTNPAGARRQVLGVFDTKWQRSIAEVSKLLGSEHVLVVHSNGLDEISINGSSHVVELHDGEIREYDVSPSDFGLVEHDVEGLKADSPSRSLELIQEALSGTIDDPGTAVVALNGGAAIYASGISTSLKNGVAMAEDVLSTGQAREKFEDLKRFSRALSDA